MVEFSNNLASESDLNSSYTESGYSSNYAHPQDSASEMINGGVNAESVEKLKSTNEKVIATSPMLRKRKFLKKLFLQYIKKYIMNPKKYIDHPKQIKNLPSWFDDAIVLFSDDELSREQKRMIREFFYGLVQYRDQQRISSGNLEDSKDETNRQLGERSPYSEEDPDSIVLPRQNEMNKINVMDIAKNVAAQNTKELQQPTMEEYVEGDAGNLPMDTIAPTQNTAGGVRFGKVSSGFSLEDYIRPMGNRSKPVQSQQLPPAVVQPQQVTRSSTLASNTQTTSFRPTSIPIGNMNIDLTGFIMGNRNKPSLISPPQPAQPQPVAQYRKQNKKIKPKLNRWAPKLGGIIPKGITLGKITLRDTNKKGAKSKGVGNISSRISLKSVMGKKAKSPKRSGGLGDLSDMNKVFAKIKTHSKNSYNPGQMKMKIVTDIKNQCGNAFKTNKFKTESLNIKKNFMKEMRESMPVMKMEMNSMGDIHEKNTLGESMRGIPRMLQVEASSPFMVKKGSMRPQSIGITEYDFDLGNIYKKKRKSLPIDEEVYFEES